MNQVHENNELLAADVPSDVIENQDSNNTYKEREKLKDCGNKCYANENLTKRIT